MSTEPSSKLKPIVVLQEDVDHLPFMERAAARVAIRRGLIIVKDAPSSKPEGAC